jgi:hypothetical protein
VLNQSQTVNLRQASIGDNHAPASTPQPHQSFSSVPGLSDSVARCFENGSHQTASAGIAVNEQYASVLDCCFKNFPDLRCEDVIRFAFCDAEHWRAVRHAGSRHSFCKEWFISDDEVDLIPRGAKESHRMFCVDRLENAITLI